MTIHLMNGKTYPKVKLLDNQKIIIEDWYLQEEYQAKAVWNHFKDGFSRSQEIGGWDTSYVQDFKKAQTSFRLVGTEKQIADWSKKQSFILDEVYSYEPIAKDSYWDGICCGTENTPSRIEYNKTFNDEYKEILKMYKANKNNLLIL